MASEFEKFVYESVSQGTCFVQEEPFGRYFVDIEYVSTKFLELEIGKLDEECRSESDKIRMAFRILKGSKQELENRMGNIKEGCIKYIDQIHQENGKSTLILPQVKNGGKSKKALKKFLSDAVSQLKFNILSVSKALHVYEIFVSRMRYGIGEIMSSIEVHYNEFPGKFVLTTEPDFKHESIGFVTNNLEVILNGTLDTVITDISAGEIKFITLEKMVELFGVEDRQGLVKVAIIAGTRQNVGLGVSFLERLLEPGDEREDLERLMEENNFKKYLSCYKI